MSSLAFSPGVLRLFGAEKVQTAFARVEVHSDPALVMKAWEELESIAPASIYQTRAFLMPWLETVGAKARLEPMFIIGRNAAGTALALLCLGILRRGPFRNAVFLGGKDSNANLGLFRPGFTYTRDDIFDLLRTATRALGSRAPDLFMLLDQPLEWEGVANPFTTFRHQKSPSYAHGTVLDVNADAFIESKLSKDTRKKLRKKESRLAASGELAHLRNDDPVLAHCILDVFFAQKTARCEEQNINAGFDDPAKQDFIERAFANAVNADGSQPALELHALRAGERIVAVYGGGTHRGHFSGMFTSFDADPEIAKSSPGDLLLMKLIAAKCREGVQFFDLGIGEARYKAAFCDQTLPLIDVFVPMNFKGQLFAAFEATRLRLKRTIKQNPRTFALVRQMRMRLR
jgi:CelD/BcsL family acetyltransferase involved in cellulose biosynthesis